MYARSDRPRATFLLVVFMAAAFAFAAIVVGLALATVRGPYERELSPRTPHPTITDFQLPTKNTGEGPVK